MTLACYSNQCDAAIPLVVLTQDQYSAWLTTQKSAMQAWLQATKYTAKAGSIALIPDGNGQLQLAVFVADKRYRFWDFAALTVSLPPRDYVLTQHPFQDAIALENFALAWGLGAYQFTRYKKEAKKAIAKLVLPDEVNAGNITTMVSSFYWGQDLINTPAMDMMPEDLARETQLLASEFNASFTQIVGEDLLTQNYPTLYAVGKGSVHAPQLLDLRWGHAHHFKLTLVGKGICFDTGGLDIKPASNMLLMKKDMAGAAHALALARIIMQLQLPIQLRVLIPTADNAISGNCYRPSDVLTTRKGLTVEVYNTDAEGRLVLCDALAEAVTDNPNLLIDFSTLTGSQRIALGSDIAGVFCNDDGLAQALLHSSEQVMDPIWRLPLHKPYRDFLNSSVADLKNASSHPWAGAIIAALFLNEFVPNHIPWLHFDFNAWNTMPKPGRPESGEVNILRALVHYLTQEKVLAVNK